MNRVIQGDCLEVLRDIPDSSVDLICTDPPYFKVKKDWWDRQWAKPECFLRWLDSIAEQWQRVLKPNGSLYCFASPKMAARVEVMLGERFNVVNRITWQKPPFATKAEMFVKEDLRGFFPASEAIIFCEQYGADNAAKGEAGYGAKCDELRGFVFAPIADYLKAERDKAGWENEDAKKAVGHSPQVDVIGLIAPSGVCLLRKFMKLGNKKHPVISSALTKNYAKNTKNYAKNTKNYAAPLP